ncbi:hypothetical protein HK101_007893, partial [Irineochytrium annulatum]
MLRKNLSELLDQGATLFSPPNQKYAEAFAKWQQASELAIVDDDLFSYARAVSNMGCAMRAMSLFEHCLALQNLAWTSAIKYVEDKQGYDETSLWLQMVLRTLDLDELDLDRMHFIDAAAYSRTIQRRTATMQNYLTGKEAQTVPDVSSGPPIVVFFMELTTNLGNAHFSLGHYEDAIDWHSKCLQLAENVLEETQLPRQFQPTVAELSAYSYFSSNPSTRLVAGSSSPRINLSYLHRSTLMAQARSLTHLGLCCQYLGLDDNAFQCHYNSSALLSFYVSRSPTFSAPTTTTTTTTVHGTPMAGGAQPSPGSATGSVGPAQPERKQTGVPSKPWMTSQMECYEASVAVNLAAALYAKGRIPASLDRLSRGLRLFNAAGDENGKSMVEASASAVKVEVGRVLGQLHWLRNMDTQARGAGEVDECKRYWGPPRLEGVNLGSGDPDESANASAGA